MAQDVTLFRGLSAFRYALRRFLAASEDISRAGGVTAQQYQVLLAIKAAEDQLTIRALADQLLLTHHAAVQMIDRLANARLAERTPSPSDRRAVLLRLTDKGEALVADLAARHLAELLRHEPLIRSSLDQLKPLASGAASMGGPTPRTSSRAQKKRRPRRVAALLRPKATI